MKLTYGRIQTPSAILQMCLKAQVRFVSEKDAIHIQTRTHAHMHTYTHIHTHTLTNTQRCVFL